MTDYNLKVGKSALVARGVNLTKLNPIPSSGPDSITLICLREPPHNPSKPLGTGDLAHGVVTVQLGRTRIAEIHAQVNDGDPTYHLSVQFNASAADLVSGFGKTYST